MYNDPKKQSTQYNSKSPFACRKQIQYFYQDDQAPKFTLKGNSSTNSYFLKQGQQHSGVNQEENNSLSNSYLHLYNQQKKSNQQLESGQQQRYPFQQAGVNQQRRQEKVADEQSVNSKLKQILQNQINNNPKQTSKSKGLFKTQAQNMTSYSMEIDQSGDRYLGNQQQNTAYMNLFNSKAHSVEIISDKKSSPQIQNQPLPGQFIRKEKTTLSKNNNQIKVLRPSELLTPSAMNQITFNDLDSEENLMSLVGQLQKENLALTKNISNLNLALQKSISENRQAQCELRQLKQRLLTQNETIEMMREESEILSNELQEKDMLISGLRMRVCEMDKQLENDQIRSRKQLPITTTAKEIDEIKNRIIARKNTSRSARGATQSGCSSDITKKDNEQVDRRKEVGEIQQSRSKMLSNSLHNNQKENKENNQHFSNESYDQRFVRNSRF